MSKFKVGDRVIVTTDFYDTKGSIQKHKIGTIKSIDREVIFVNMDRRIRRMRNPIDYCESDIELLDIWNTSLYNLMKENE